MPSYDYYSDVTHEVKEVFHAMNEHPQILDSQGNVMKRKISGGTGILYKAKGFVGKHTHGSVKPRLAETGWKVDLDKKREMEENG